MPSDAVLELARRGVLMPAPELIHVGAEVDLSRIEAGVVLHPFSRVEGPRSLIGRGSKIGSGGPATVRDCVLGRDVDLSSGTFESSIFLDGAAFGPSGHARAGTLFEEGAKAAHACGVKQTILLPFATLGSDINFCDCLLAGGTSAEDHSEVGSGFIHFNFMPVGAHGDKATPSLFGDVVRGVFLRERRIFLGGDGGVVGPVRIGYGTVLAAGSTYRKDRGEGVLVYAEALPPRERAFDAVLFRGAEVKVAKNLAYLSELAALRAFYDEARRALVLGDAHASAVVDAAVALIDDAAVERVKQLEKLAGDFRRSAARLVADGAATDAGEAAYQRRFADEFGDAKAALADLAGAARTASRESREAFAQALPKGGGYLPWVRAASSAALGAGRKRLEAVSAAYLAAPIGAARFLK